jgi:hypothetical protein
MLARWLHRLRPGRARRARKLTHVQPFENPYRHGICSADWTKK